MEKEGVHEAPSLADELLAVVTLGGRRIVFFSDVSTGKLSLL